MKARIPPPLVMLSAALLMWALHRFMPLGELLASPWNRLGWIPVALGIGIAMTAFKGFQRAQTTVNPRAPESASHLVTDGVFRISRNPMYLGLTLLLTGWALLLGTASPWILPPLFVIFISYWQIIPEEQALEKIFGEPYRAYRQRVARWIGRP